MCYTKCSDTEADAIIDSLNITILSGATTSISSSLPRTALRQPTISDRGVCHASKRDLVLLINDKGDELWLRFLLYVDQ